MDIKEQVLNRLKREGIEVINLYLYGSRVYGTASNDSDWDFIVVCKDDITGKQIKHKLYDITFYQEEDFVEKIEVHEISVLECLFLDESQMWIKNKSYRSYFNLNKSKLRTSISTKASNSWVKAKKKVEVEESYDLNTAQKSLFHSLRILSYGLQLAKYGCINNYSCSNEVLKKVRTLYSWEAMNNTFKKDFNRLKTEFKLLAPK